jgi:hypothetical protein
MMEKRLTALETRAREAHGWSPYKGRAMTDDELDFLKRHVLWLTFDCQS